MLIKKSFLKLIPFRKLNNIKNPTVVIENNKLTLILDLDLTLVYTSAKKIENSKNYAIIDNKYFVYKRPFLDDVLNTVIFDLT